LQSIILVPLLGGTRCQVLLFIKAEYSKSIAFFQFLSPKDSFIFCGSPDDVKNPYRIVPSVYTFVLRMSAYNRVMGLDISGAFVAAAGDAASSGTEDPDGCPCRSQ
jgi:hypothetical protein